jgi:hypothetical protein
MPSDTPKTLSNALNDDLRAKIPPNGGIGFCRSKGLVAKVIRLGEWLRFRKGEINHAFIVHPSGRVYQAEARGVTNTRMIEDVAPGGDVWIYPFPDDVRPEAVFRFCKTNIGKRYGWFSIIAIALDIILPLWTPALRRPDTWICSALAAEALRAGGWVRDGLWPDIYVVTPTQLRDALD